MRFGPAARRLSGLAGVLLGWRPDDFWRATPAELATMLEALAGEEAPPLARDEMAALIARFPD